MLNPLGIRGLICRKDDLIRQPEGEGHGGSHQKRRSHWNFAAFRSTTRSTASRGPSLTTALPGDPGENAGLVSRR